MADTIDVMVVGPGVEIETDSNANMPSENPPKVKSNAPGDLDRHGWIKRFRIKALVATLFCLLLGGVLTAWYYYNGVRHDLWLSSNFKFNEVTQRMYIRRGDDLILGGYLGMNIDATIIPFNCRPRFPAIPSGELCIDWPKFGKLILLHEKPAHEIDCYLFTWMLYESKEVSDCFNVTKGLWYGGAETTAQKFPIGGSDELPVSPFVTGSLMNGDAFGSVLERYWLISTGAGIYVDFDSPLYVSQSETTLCLVGRRTPPYSMTSTNFTYTICTSENIKTTHSHMRDNFVLSGDDLYKVPDNLDLINYPMFSLFNQQEYSSVLTQDYVEHTALSMSAYNDTFANATVVIDDGWESSYGDFIFEPVRFPNPDSMFSMLRNLSFKPGLFIHPFANVDSKTFLDGIRGGFWVKDGSGKVAGLQTWIHGMAAAALDTTNNESVSWFKNRVYDLISQYKLTVIDFGHGEVTTLPFNPVFSKQVTNPATYSNQYCKLVADISSEFLEVHVGSQTQRLPIFVSMAARNCSWSSETNGIRTVIPAALTFSVIGYPLYIPDAVGGSDCFEEGGGTTDTELYIRWLQMTVFMPVWRFARLPHHISKNNETLSQVRRLLSFYNDLRKRVIVPDLKAWLSELPRHRTPPIMPVWWLSETDKNALVVDDEFLFVGKYLVAPVLYRGSRYRSIFLPDGKWKDAAYPHQMYEGPFVIANYSAPIDVLPYFILIN